MLLLLKEQKFYKNYTFQIYCSVWPAHGTYMAYFKLTKNYFKTTFHRPFFCRREHTINIFLLFFYENFYGVPRVSLHDERTDGGSSPPGQSPPTASVLPVHRSQPGFRNFQTYRNKKKTKIRSCVKQESSEKNYQWVQNQRFSWIRIQIQTEIFKDKN